MSNKEMQVFVVKKVWDEGTTSPYPARLMLQMFGMRDELIHNEKEKMILTKLINQFWKTIKS